MLEFWFLILRLFFEKKKNIYRFEKKRGLIILKKNYFLEDFYKGDNF